MIAGLIPARRDAEVRVAHHVSADNDGAFIDRFQRLLDELARKERTRNE
jgi:hypothetical protein